MAKNRVKISSIVQNQVPSFVKDDFPLIAEFLSEYYRSQEIDGGSYDLIQNIDQYLNLDTLTSFTSSTTVKKPDDESYSVNLIDDVIFVESTKGFPDQYGLIKIDDEIITYKSKTNNSFIDCVRGFSGIESLTQVNNPEFLLFSETSAQDHANSSTVENLSSIFLASFLDKTKKLFSPGFEGRKLTSELNQKLFLSHSKDFYTTKGTDKSFEILFKALYGTDVKVIRPKDFLIQPSDAGFRVTQDLVVESILGDPKDLLNRTLFQDQKYDFLGAYGSVTSVEKITRNNKEYYILSLDFDYDKDINVQGSIYGQFSIHPKTKLTAPANLNAQTIDVDSTVGFPESGTLVANLPNGNTLNITYTSKSITQFYGCSGISEDILDSQEILLDVYAYAILDKDSDLRIEVRIGGVLSEINIPENTFQYKKGENAKIISLGSSKYNSVADNWLFNIPIKYNPESFVWLNSTSAGDPDPEVFNYEISTLDENNIYSGNSVTLDIIVQTSSGNLENIKKTFVVSSVSVPKKSFTINNDSKITSVSGIVKNISKVVGYDFQANVQNTYIDSDNSVYVASSSLPNYSGSKIDVRDGSIRFTGLFGNPSSGITTDIIVFKGDGGSLRNHRFLSGDAISYLPGEGSNKLSINKGTYFVKKIDRNTIKLATSRENIIAEVFVQFSGNVTNNLIVPFEFVDSNLNQKTLDNQKLIRKISTSPNKSGKVKTNPGKLGIFSNGVELLNYKSNDILHYGKMEEISVSSRGEGYDIINPPILELEDSTGSGAEGICSVEGSLVRLDILDTGFDYLQTPNVFIQGGNGSGAIAKAFLRTVDHFAEFYSEEKSNLIDLTNNTITFINNHKFRNNERVYYITKGQSEIGGLIDNSLYYISVEDKKTIKLYNTFEDSISGISTISLTSYGSGTQFFKSYNKKKILGSVDIINSGSGYKNNRIVVKPENIVLETDCVSVKSHGFNDGDFIKYSSSGSTIGGLSNNAQYIVTKIDNNLFKLSEIGSDEQLSFYKTNRYVEFSDIGSGEHTFKDIDITVSIQGSVGVNSPSDEFIAKVNPVFRGSVKSVFLKEKGAGYGSEEVLNFKKIPKYKLNSGSGAKIKPVIINGAIKSVLVINSGSNYNSSPEITIVGDGTGCILTPIVENGLLKEVKVINSGLNYNANNTTLLVSTSGKNCNLQFTLQSWRINLVERLKNSNQITNNGGIISRSLNPSYGLQYTHAYTSSALRNITFSEKKQDGQSFYKSDLSNDLPGEKYHSPIIGWSYDGSPIYGPYGYDQVEGGLVRQMIGGYSSPVSKENRPSLSLFPLGFFVEDYTFDGEGDLDESNGRFCKTPEFPNGVYAYFTSLDTTAEKNPKFPYVIGNVYNSHPEEFNFKSNSNQNEIDINQTKWLRYTLPYNLNSSQSEYEYLINPPKIKEQLARITSTFTGKVDNYIINKSGDGYKIGDKLRFDNTNTGGQNAYAEVSSLLGKEVESISYSKASVFGAEVSPTEKSNEYIVFSNSPHNIKNKEIISISGLGTYFSQLEKSYTANVKSSSLTLSENVLAASSTGIVTYFNVYGNLNYPNIRENDIYIIGSEEIKILNIDKNSSRIRVLRESDGSAYQSGDLLTESPRKLRFTASDAIPYNYELSNEIYFDPSESLGTGTVGIGTTLTIENPGVGITQVFAPLRNIYIPNHIFKTGDSLRYFSNGNTPISVSNGTSDFNLPENTNIFVAKFNDDFIGLSTVKVGIGTTGNFVGVGTDTEILFFNNVGSGKDHSFKTIKSSVVSADIDKREVTLTTKESHGIFEGDHVTIDCKSTSEKTITLKYDSVNDRILVDQVDFESGDVDSSLSTITIQNHDFTTGEKVIYSSNSPSAGLVNNEIYYIVVKDSNTIKLSSSYYNANLSVPITLSITSSAPGSISKINPRLTFFYDQTVMFDLSDSSLSLTYGASKISAFEFILSKNSIFTEEFVSSTKKDTFDLTFNGEIGFDGSFAKLKVSESIPNILYYTLIPTESAKLLDSSLKVVNDQEFISKSNRIEIRESFYNGNHLVIKSTDTTLKYSIKNTPEESEYTSGVKYYSTSSGSTGGIHKISSESGGFGYKNIPSIETVVSAGGSNAIILPQSTTIGKIKSVNIEDIGFDYSSDKSIRPLAKFPDILKIEPLSSFVKIDVISPGNGYNVSPNIVVIDSVTNKIVSDISLLYEIGNNELIILENSKGFYNAEPKIIPTNNSNGVGINSISFNTSTKEALVEFSDIFADNEEFPFKVGDDVFIENVTIVEGTGTGYNSADYNYSYFKVTEISKSFGGFGSFIKLDFSPFVEGAQVLGTYNSFRSSARAIPVKDFPIFKSTLKKNDFFIGEEVVSDSSIGKVNTWDPKNEIMKVETSDAFEVDSFVVGSTSGSVGLIAVKYETNTEYNVDSLSLVNKNWSKETGFLNNSTQRIQNSDYYQNFSYSIRSSIPYETWKDPVESLNHISGFKKFSDLELETYDVNYSGISTSQSDGTFTSIAFLSEEIDVDCYNDFDLASENATIVNNSKLSNEIVLNSTDLQDYSESVGNRVLRIDDFIDQFNSVEVIEDFTSIDTLDPDVSTRKYILYLQDKTFTDEREVLILTLVNDEEQNYFMNQYGKTYSITDLGDFDTSISGSVGKLLFYPNNSVINNYTVSYTKYEISGGAPSSPQTLGSIASVSAQRETVPADTTHTILTLPNTDRSAKVIFEHSGSNGFYQLDELNIVHDGTEVYFSNYGELNNFNNLEYTSGLGTYFPRISGSNLIIDFIPSISGVAVTSSSVIVSLNNNGVTGGEADLLNSRLGSNYKSISSSVSPSDHVVASYPKEEFSSCYFIVSIEDTVNGDYEMGEILVLNTSNDAFITEYGFVQTNSSLGTFEVNNASSLIELTFTPNPNIGVEVRVYENTLRLNPDGTDQSVTI